MSAVDQGAGQEILCNRVAWEWHILFGHCILEVGGKESVIKVCLMTRKAIENGNDEMRWSMSPHTQLFNALKYMI